MTSMLNQAISYPWLLAERRDYRIGRGFQPDEGGISSEHLLIATAAVLMIVIASWIVANAWKRRQEQPYNNPRKLFRELCRAHGLSVAESQVLRDIAARHQLSNPSQLFLDRDLFNAPELANRLDERETIEELRDILFDETPDSEQSLDESSAANSVLARSRHFLASLMK